MNEDIMNEAAKKIMENINEDMLFESANEAARQYLSKDLKERQLHVDLSNIIFGENKTVDETDREMKLTLALSGNEDLKSLFKEISQGIKKEEAGAVSSINESLACCTRLSPSDIDIQSATSYIEGLGWKIVRTDKPNNAKPKPCPICGRNAASTLSGHDEELKGCPRCKVFIHGSHEWEEWNKYVDFVKKEDMAEEAVVCLMDIYDCRKNVFLDELFDDVL